MNRIILVFVVVALAATPLPVAAASPQAPGNQFEPAAQSQATITTDFRTSQRPVFGLVAVSNLSECAGEQVLLGLFAQPFDPSIGAAITFAASNIALDASGSGEVLVYAEGNVGITVVPAVIAGCVPSGFIQSEAPVTFPYVEPPLPRDPLPAGQTELILPANVLNSIYFDHERTFVEALGPIDVYASGVFCGSWQPSSRDRYGTSNFVLGLSGQPLACSRSGAEICLERGDTQQGVRIRYNQRYTLTVGESIWVDDVSPAPPHTEACGSKVAPAPPNVGQGLAGASDRRWHQVSLLGPALILAAFGLRRATR